MVEPLAAAKVSNARQWSSYLTSHAHHGSARVQQLIAERDERFVGMPEPKVCWIGCATQLFASYRRPTTFQADAKAADTP
jgi:hypothetical protein